MSGARIVHIALGGNVGDRLGTLAAALERLDRTPGIRVVAVSPAYETEPVGPPQADFVNAAAAISTTLDLPGLLEALQATERALGRDRASGERWGPRSIDLDILVDGESCIDRPGLTVPHPRLAERPFVLIPLSDIAPDLRVPPGGRSIRSLVADHGSRAPSRVRRIGPIAFQAAPCP